GVVGMKGGWFNRLQDAFGASDTRKGVTVEVTPESAVRVNVSVLMEYGAFAPQVFEDVKNAVVKSVTGMTGLSVAGVNLRIEDVLTAEEIAARNNEALPEPEQRNRLDQMLVTTDEELEPEVEFEINPSEAEDVEEADEE
ncbi:MAG: Asp23/Gls24 family envelope stress response protein, partial [Atopobiaceae bacterium]|nr:Asp23/Gls24 family envelope stress response protein [Atopobiaceae bacterium]